MTSIEWLIEEMLSKGYFDGNKPLTFTNLDHLQQQAKEMHKQEIIDARDNMQKYCIELANKINPHLFEFNKKDGEQYYQETFVSKGSDATFSQTEISDEEIEKAKENAWSDYEYQEGNLYSTTFSDGWKMAIKWYREQLKQL
jgi:hypothetical protein